MQILFLKELLMFWASLLLHGPAQAPTFALCCRGEVPGDANRHPDHCPPLKTPQRSKIS